MRIRMLNTGEVRDEAELYALRLIEQGRAEAAGAGEPEAGEPEAGEPEAGEPEDAGKKPGRKKGPK